MVRGLLIIMLASALVACASVHRLDAANDVHALLLSIRDDDQATFDAHVDRAALKKELQAKLDERLAKDDRLKGLAALLGPQVVDFAGDALVQPRVFKVVAEQYGYTPATRIPGPVVIASALKVMPDGRVCATKKKDGPCLLMFTKEEGVWKLTGFEGDTSMLRIKL
ncbi:hypothetical protein DJ021_06745 [Phenylobacterium hankyongense]|uniref:DUF2939 domain-containing protein n=1 Tax=Phenylobacterium hankyongense TaxID=1813876 RepID=A0A328AXY7_9CAUL|nr:DUF2939 domain-containing protein [Phenylobacterium hankyongense]RAK59519.1 hypothetical protein DJ021_06745 [Phenylobacterium hankyongense]